jgi:manganese-dependent inorganic pyrophosphatase
MRKIVTSYIKPDIDGISSMYAYAELLRKMGYNAEYYYEGQARKEVQIVLETYGIELKTVSQIFSDDEVILVDTNGLRYLPKAINANQIKEVIDHHKMNEWLSKQKDIKIQIEMIGAAATLVAERFKNNNIDISRESAILLYNGIISNTMNLKISMTTQKDKDMAHWLKQKYPEITEEKTKAIFIKKSEITDRLREEMEVEFKDEFITISWSMGQLEIANVEEFLNRNEEKVRAILKKVKDENNVDYISVNCMDIINGYTIILAENEATANIISAINVKFIKLKAKIDKLVSRKEIIKIIRAIYKK